MFSQPIKVTYDKIDNKVSLSIIISEDIVIVKKMTTDEYKYVLAHMNAFMNDMNND